MSVKRLGELDQIELENGPFRTTLKSKKIEKHELDVTLSYKMKRIYIN